MTILVIRTLGIIDSPMYGKIDNILDPEPPASILSPAKNPRLLLDLREYTGVQGATINNIVATGTGIPQELTFNENRAGTDWGFPTYDATEKPSMSFNGTQAIANSNLELNLVGSSSYIVIGKTSTVGSINNKRSRIFTGNINGGFHGLYPITNKFTMGAGMNNEVVTDVGIPGGWFVGIFVYNGVNSRMILSDDFGIKEIAGVAESTASRIFLGGNVNFTSHSTSALVGNIALFAQYDRVLTDSELLKTMEYYRQQFNI